MDKNIIVAILLELKFMNTFLKLKQIQSIFVSHYFKLFSPPSFKFSDVLVFFSLKVNFAH